MSQTSLKAIADRVSRPFDQPAAIAFTGAASRRVRAVRLRGTVGFQRFRWAPRWGAAMTTGTHVREPSAATVKEVRGWASATLPPTIATAAVTVGVLDGAAAALFSPISAPRVFQYVASGLLGARSFEGGPTTVALGIALHLLVATAVASVYVLASRHLPLLLRRPVLCGLGYGAAVYFFMRHVVVPLSAISPPPFSLPAMLRGLTIHLVCVGLPVALVTRWLSPPHDGAEAR